jgi:hypothetical protein
MINQMNMIHMMNNHNTTGTVCNITGVDVVIIIVGFILLLWGGVKVTEWLFDKTYKMKEPWDTIVFIVGMFSYVIVSFIVITLFVILF